MYVVFDTPGRSIQEALNVPLTRMTMAVAVMDMWEIDAEKARCYTGKVIQEFTIEELRADAPSQADAKKISELAASCIS